MKTRFLAIVLFLLAAGTAFADVSNEVLVGLEGDSTKEVTNSLGADLTGTIKNTNSLFTAQYTHFFAPLVEDDKHIDLRRFYQHPSSVTAGLAFFGSTDKNSSIPALATDSKANVGVLLLGGEYYFPTNTGLFLNIGFGSGTAKETIGGTAQPDTDLQVSSSDLGVRQYVGQSVAFELRFHDESTEYTPDGQPETSVSRNITYFGVQGVISDVVGLKLEVGGGERKDKTAATTTYDIAAVNAEIAAYAGNQLSFRLGLEFEAEDMNGLPSGFGLTNTKVQTTLAARYWFSERFGMELPIYAVTTEQKTTVPIIGEVTQTTKNNGIGLYAAFRF